MTGNNADQIPGKATDGHDSLSLRHAQMELLSRILGHVTHDVQNHLAVINESAGWMEDLLKLKTKKGFGWFVRLFKRNQGQQVNAEPFFKGLNSIQEHVALGSMLTQRLSGFAQRLEEPEAVFDANKALEEIRDVLLRQAMEKNIQLRLQLSKEAPMIQADPPAFQLALFGNVEQVIEDLERGSSLAVEAEVREDQFQLHLTSSVGEGSPGLLPEDPGNRDFSQQIFEDLGGQIWSRSSDGKRVTTLAFPLAGQEA